MISRTPFTTTATATPLPFQSFKRALEHTLFTSSKKNAPQRSDKARNDKEKAVEEEKIVLSHQQKLQQHYKAKEAKALFSATTRERTTYYTSVLNAVALPATILWPNRTCDLVLALSIPVHAHVGLTHVIEDYVPDPRLRSALKRMLLGTSLAAIACSVHFCSKNIGFGRAIRRFWEI